MIAREVARLHPEAVAGSITYGTPVGGPMYTTVARAYGRGATTTATGRAGASTRATRSGCR